jgi:transcription initiation factor TFIIIB Brf1 subunit/transcription initiation factor TFIIB
MEAVYIASVLGAAFVSEPVVAKVTLRTETRIEPQQQVLLTTLQITRSVYL